MFSRKFGKPRPPLVQDLDHNEPVTMESVMKLQQHKPNPHEPIFLSVKQYEELCKTTYDGNVPFTFTAIVGDKRDDEARDVKNDSDDGVEENKDDITVSEVVNDVEEPYVPSKKKKAKK